MSIQAEISYGITIFIVFLGIIVKHSRFLFLCQIVWMIILVGGNTDSLDYPINEALYYSEQQLFFSGEDSGAGLGGLLGWLYGYSIYIFRDVLDFDFYLYNFVISAVSILIIAIVVKRLAKSYTTVFSLIYLYPCCEMVIQKRFLPAMAIMLMGLLFLSKNDKSSKIAFWICFLFSIGMHSSMIFYVVIYFLIDYMGHSSISKKKLIAFFAFEMIFMVFSTTLLKIFLPADKVELYFVTYAESSSISHFFFWAILHVSVFLLVNYLHRKIKNDRYSDYIWRLNLSSLFIIPLYSVDPVFMRYFRDVLIFDYIFLTNYLHYGSCIRKRDFIAGYGAILSGFIFCYVWYYAGIGQMTFTRMMKPIFENNFLLDYLFLAFA